MKPDHTNNGSIVSRLLRRFRKNERGSVMALFAIAIIPMMVAAGLAVDLSRAYLIKSRLSHALDAAGLAVGSMRTTTTDTAYLEQQFTNFVNANYPSAEVGATHDLTYVDNGGVISVTGKATVETVFMAIVGINNMTVSASAEIIVETNGLELMMVLDNTGSMGSYNKLEDMKTAAHDLIDILFGNEALPDLLKVGLVPFSGSVNIGTSMSSSVADTSTYDWGSTSWEGCVEARAYPYDVQDADTGTGGLWAPYHWADHNSYNNWDRDTYYAIDNSPPSSRGPNKYCPRPLTPLTNDRASLESEIDAMWAAGYTHINYGAVWGWRAISPSAPFTEGSSYSDPDWNKVVIILTDGDNTTSNSVDTAYGYRSDGLLGSTTSWGTASELDSRLLEVCTGMKNDGIIVYTIAFGTSIGWSTASMMEDCATKPSNYFESPDSATLSLAFRAIGAELKNLHLSQ